MALTPQPTSRAAASVLLRLQRGPVALSCADLHPQGAFLLAGTESGEVQILGISNGEVVQHLVDAGKAISAVTCVAWSEVEGIECAIAGHKNGSVRVWDVESRAGLPLLATGSADSSIRLWSLAGTAFSSTCGSSGGSSRKQPRVLRSPAHTLHGHKAPITALAFSPDAELLISGDSKGGLCVWQVDAGSSGRLLHDLSGRHSSAVTGIACHPEERLFATCSLDKTLRVWDMDSQPGTCIGMYGPQGRREVRSVAFAAAGRALLAAYPDSLRTFTLDPLAHQDTAEVAWTQVSAICYTDGKCIGTSMFKGDLGLHCMDLTKLRPFAKAATATSGGAVNTSSTGSAAPGQHVYNLEASSVSTYPVRNPHACDVPSTISAACSQGAPTVGLEPAAANRQQAGPAAVFVAAQRRAAVLESRAVNARPKVEVFSAAPPARSQAQHASFIKAAPSRPAGRPSGGPAAPAQRSSSSELVAHRVSAAPEGKPARHRLSAQENALSSSMPSSAEAGKPDQPACPSTSSPSMLAVATHGGFQAAAMQRSSEQRNILSAKRSLWQETQGMLRRGAVLEAVRLLAGCNDLSVAAKVIETGAMQRQHDCFTLEVCTATVPLIGSLLGSSTSSHHQAALQLLDAILTRWGGYVGEVMRAAVRLQGKVDLELERRHALSKGLCDGLQQLAPSLERLAKHLSGGRAQQTLGRLRALVPLSN